MQIYFGDMAHTTVGLATDCFPLNIGYVAAYSKKVYGDKIEVSLFKEILELEAAIERDPPDVLAMSNYAWCHQANKALFDVLNRKRPDAIRIMGGPNFPHAPHEQLRFLKDRPWIDTYVYLDGEYGFSNIIGKILESDSLAKFRERILIEPIAGCVHLSFDGERLTIPNFERPKILDELPSPYLTGLLDPFFDSPFSPMISTNRGCPFTCTFCHDGDSSVNQVTKFSSERVKAEIEYIGERVAKTQHSLTISDLNFGMFKNDLPICEALANSRDRTGYPAHIKTTTGKNSKKRVIETVKQLKGALKLSMSVQSLDDDVLSNIKRSNIRVDEITGLQTTIRKSKLPATSEIILALPGETFESHKATLGALLDAGMDQILPYTLMLVEGSAMNLPSERKKWGFESKFRIIPLDFTKLANGEKIIEIEEVVIATNTLSFSEYIEARNLVFLIKLLQSYGLKPLLRYLREVGVQIMDLVEMLRVSLLNKTKNGTLTPANLVQLFREFEADTVRELWDTKEELIKFYQDDKNYGRLLDRLDGKNLLQHYHAYVISNFMPDVIDWIFEMAKVVLLKDRRHPRFE
jgi:radical SAM superfamily enzyme YgiQ (UPF0313 family)